MIIINFDTRTPLSLHFSSSDANLNFLQQFLKKKKKWPTTFFNFLRLFELNGNPWIYLTPCMFVKFSRITLLIFFDCLQYTIMFAINSCQLKYLIFNCNVSYNFDTLICSVGTFYIHLHDRVMRFVAMPRKINIRDIFDVNF